MAEGGKDPEVIMAPDKEDDRDDWPDTGPWNLEEAQAYTDKIIQIFDMFGNLIHKDKKDTLLKMI